jgi:PAS domain S-box-containing protein
MTGNPHDSLSKPGLPDAFASLMRSIDEYAIIIMDKQGVILDWNSGATLIFGYTREEVQGKNAAFLSIPEDIDKGIPQLELKSTLSSGKGDEERFYLRKDGTRYWGSGVMYPLLRENGEAIGLVKIIRDVSSLREARDALLESETKYEFILENLKDHAIFLINAEGLIISWNKGTERVFGHTEAEAMGQPFSKIFTEEDVKAGIPGQELIIALTKGKAEDERWHLRKDGSRFWASGAVVPIKGDKQTGRFIKVLRDATERKRAEDADRMDSMGRLAGGVAHDFNNLLTSILGYCELLSDDGTAAAAKREWLDEVLKAANRAAALTRDLLTFTSKQVMTPRAVDINEIIRKMDGLLRMTLGEDIEFSTSLDPKLEKAHLDKNQFQQVLLNLTLNAKEAMPRGGKVNLATANVNAGPGEVGTRGETSPYVSVVLKDTGKGMDVETAAHVFEPFFSTKPKAVGSVGLGLSTTYGIIQQSGGTIAVTSVPDSGTEFEIHLPVLREETMGNLAGTAPGRVESPPIAKAEAAKETILLVEDETAVRKLAAEVLRRSGYSILEAADGAEGLLVFEQHGHAIGLVITDVLMPNLGGMGLARRIRSLSPNTPILFMSGYSEDDLANQGLEDGMGMFLQKPFTISGFLKKVQEAVAMRNKAGAESG